MTIYTATATALEKAGLGKRGSDLFIYHSPDDAKGILVMESQDGITRNEYIPGYYKGEFKVVIRNIDYEKAILIAKDVVANLNLYSQNLDDVFVHRMRAVYEPITYAIPDSGIIETEVDIWAAFSDL